MDTATTLQLISLTVQILQLVVAYKAMINK